MNLSDTGTEMGKFSANSHNNPTNKSQRTLTSGFSILNYRRENFNPIASKIDYARIQNAFGTVDDPYPLIGVWIDKTLEIESTSNTKIQLFVDGKKKNRNDSNFLEQWNKVHESVESRLSSLNTSLKLANLHLIDSQVMKICIDLSRHHGIPFYCGMSLTPNCHSRV